MDAAGNGGGFVFDARSLPNPGREERFRAFNGKDAVVIEYLAAEESVRQYLEHVFALVDASVAEYQRRGFSSLMVSFGCTGGQHISVYLAEQLAKHLGGHIGVNFEGSIWNRRSWADEGDDSGRGAGDAAASAHE